MNTTNKWIAAIAMGLAAAGGSLAANAQGCDAAALTRNVELGKKHRISGTPTLLFVDGKRVPGAVAAAQVEKMLADAK